MVFKEYFEYYDREATSVLLGFAIHTCLFRKGEWDLAAKSILKIYSLSFVLLNIFLFPTGQYTSSFAFFQSFLETCRLSCIHFLGLAVSICLYRRVFHRLRDFPGPFFASLSSWYMLRYAFRNQHQSEAFESYHHKYGDYVRVGPNKLSIADPAAIKAVYGRGSGAGKGPFYDITQPRTDLHSSRDKADHTRRRKHWDKALSVGEMRNHAPTVTKHTERLVSQIQARSGESTNIAKWLDLFSFDVMFDLGFGKDMQRLTQGKEDFYVLSVHQTMKTLGVFQHVPWVIQFLNWIPTFAAQYHKFKAYSQNLVNERLSQATKSSDIFSFIIKTYEEIPNKTPKDMENLTGDADLVVLAGADSTAVALANIFYQLAQHPEQQEKLGRELATVESAETLQLLGNEYLDAVIKESLRLIPLAPVGHERMTPPQGLYIGEQYIPGNVTVFIPNFATWRDSRSFEHPHSYIPERWIDREELNKDPSVFVPFQLGDFACPGRNLAFMKMRSVIYSIVSRYNIQGATSDLKADYFDKRQDRWLLGVGELNLIFQELQA